MPSYSPIVPLPTPEAVAKLASAELAGLRKIWRKRRVDLEESGLEAFQLRLRREWAIETGLIERLYAWDHGVTETLIEQGIHAALIEKGGLDRDRAEQARRLIDDQQNVIDGLFAFVKQSQQLSQHYIRSLHQEFTAHQDFTEAATPDGKLIEVRLRKGAYKEHPNNPRRLDGQIHYYCPPEQVSGEMERLVTWAGRASDAPPEVLAAWLHHRFTQIHPFQDGNGRVARALASLVFLRTGLFPLVIRNSDRAVYLDSLAMADDGDLRPLIELFADRQREAVLQALGLVAKAGEEPSAEAIAASALEELKRRAQVTTEDEVLEIETLEQSLVSIAEARVTELCKFLKAELGTLSIPEVDPSCDVTAFEDQSSPRQNLLTIGRLFNYLPTPGQRSRIVQIDIVTWNRFRLVIDVHGFGLRFQGIKVVAAYTYQLDASLQSLAPRSPVKPAMSDLYQFNAFDERAEAEERFRHWLENDVLIKALEDWRLTLGS